MKVSFLRERTYLILLAIILLSILMRFPMLGWYHGDSGVLALYTRSVYEQLHNIHYTYPGYVVLARYEYPPLYVYMIVSFYFLFGVSYLSGCLVTFLFSVLTVIATFYLGKILYNSRTGLISALILAILPWHIVYGDIILIDSVAAFFITIAFIAFWQALQKEKWINFILFGILFGVSLLTKTYNAMFVPIFIIYFALHQFLWEKNEGSIRKYFAKKSSVILKFVTAFIISFIIFAPWLLTDGLAHFTYTLVLKFPPSYKVDPFFGIKFLALEFKFFIFFFFLGLTKTIMDRERQGVLLFLWFLIPVGGFTILAYSFRILHARWNFPRYVLVVAPVVCVLATSGLNYVSEIIHAIYIPSRVRHFFDYLKGKNKWFMLLLKKKNGAMIISYTFLILSSSLVIYRYAHLLNIGFVYFAGTNVISDKEYVIEITSQYINSNLPDESVIIASNSDIYWMLKFYTWPPMDIRSKDDMGSIIKSQQIYEFFYVTYDTRDANNDLSGKPLEVTLIFSTSDPHYAHIKCYLYRCNIIN